MRRIVGTRRVGHAGTLDPMATGVLVLGINRATKLLTWVSGESKTYGATIRLGQATVTDDAEGEVTRIALPEDVESVEDDRISAVVDELTGDIMQVPSSVSAIKVKGVRSYAKVRSGQDVELEARPVTIHEFAVHDIRRSRASGEDAAPEAVIDIDVTVSCTSGTYVRALARDMGESLGIGGHLTALRRLTVGDVSIDDAWTLEDLDRAGEHGDGVPMLSIEQAAERIFARRELTDDEASAVSNGRWIEPTDASPKDSTGQSGNRSQDVVPAQELSAGFAPDGSLVALIQDQRRRGRDVAVPHLVFRPGVTFPAGADEGEKP